MLETIKTYSTVYRPILPSDRPINVNTSEDHPINGNMEFSDWVTPQWCRQNFYWRGEVSRGREASGGGVQIVTHFENQRILMRGGREGGGQLQAILLPMSLSHISPVRFMNEEEEKMLPAMLPSMKAHPCPLSAHGPSLTVVVLNRTRHTPSRMLGMRRDVKNVNKTLSLFLEKLASDRSDYGPWCVTDSLQCSMTDTYNPVGHRVACSVLHSNSPPSSGSNNNWHISKEFWFIVSVGRCCF